MSIAVIVGELLLIHMLDSPQGVGMGRKPQLWLKDGDQVEVSLDSVGSCVNKVVYEKPLPKL